MNSFSKGFAAIVLTAAVALGASGCSQDTPAVSASPSVDAAELTGAKAAAAVKDFVAASTSDQVAEEVAGTPSAKTFAPAVKFLERGTDADIVQDTVTEFVLVKMAAPKAPVAVEIDESKVVVEGQSARIPVEAVTVTSGGAKVANSDVLAESVNDLVFRDGAWVITFPAAAEATPSASPSASAK